MSEILWKSIDGYVVVADRVSFDQEGQDELAALFLAGAWIVIWRGDSDRWQVTRNRRHAKPNLRELRGQMRADGWAGSWYVQENGQAGRQDRDDDGDGVSFAQALYAAWGTKAAEALPSKIAFLKLDAGDYTPDQVPAWLRPGIPRQQEMHRQIQEVLYGE